MKRIMSLLLSIIMIGLSVVVFGTPPAAGSAGIESTDAVTLVYWTEISAGTIRRGNANGSGSSQICVSGQSSPRGLVISNDTGKMYWAEKSGNRLRRANLDCPASGVETIGPSVTNPDRMAIDPVGGKIYWTENDAPNPAGNRIRRMNLNGTSPETILDGLGGPVGIAVDNATNRIYWTEFATDSIWRASLDGSNPQLVLQLHQDANPLEIVLDVPGNRMYWASGTLGAIYSATLNGGSSGVWRTLNTPRSLAIDLTGGKLYWADQGSKEIRRDNLSKGNDELLFNAADGVDQPLGVALYSESSACYALSRQHTGQGANPAANPTNSTGCPSGQYTAGASITLTADPADGWHVSGWSGTTNNGSTDLTNTAVMPAGNHTVSVTYEQDAVTCYILSRQHTGQGANPAANPTNTTGCPSGQYIAGASITLTADPADGWHVGGWSGTTNNGSTSEFNTAVMPAGNHTVSVTYEQDAVTCYILSRQHTGQGANPAANPTNSTGCPSGQYIAGASITLTADPADGWHVSGWSGTTNNGSTSEFNTAVMPAGNHTVSVSYEQDPITCYTLSRQHTGQGANPAANPTNSTGCPSGQYTAGATISLTADPADGWHVSGWSGTTNNSSTAESNTAVMPAGNHTVIVFYEQDAAPCYSLSRQHTGQGANPIASPPGSTGCSTGQYTAGATITLTADPDPGWHVSGWSGTTNNGSTSEFNTTVMPAGNHTVIVFYEQDAAPCYSLSRQHTGQGDDPIASPPGSSGCSTGQYVAGATINLTADPADGWHVSGWSGTTNNSSTATTNTVTMPAGNHTIIVFYDLIPPSASRLFLPITYSSEFCFEGPNEREPNNENDGSLANGPLCMDGTYFGWPNDARDFFMFQTHVTGRIQIEVTELHGDGMQLQLRSSSSSGPTVAHDTEQGDGLGVELVNAAPGRYYIYIYVETPNPSETRPYVVQLSSPR